MLWKIQELFQVVGWFLDILQGTLGDPTCKAVYIVCWNKNACFAISNVENSANPNHLLGEGSPSQGIWFLSWDFSTSLGLTQFWFKTLQVVSMRRPSADFTISTNTFARSTQKNTVTCILFYDIYIYIIYMIPLAAASLDPSKENVFSSVFP